MNEIIINVYLIIEDNYVKSFRAVAYEIEGGDDNKIEFLKSKVKEDFAKSFYFDAPVNKNGKFMKYPKFAKLEKQGMQYQLFEEIFEKFKVPQNPLICVTPVVDGKILG